MGKPRTYSCWDTSVKIQEASHGLGVYGNTYEVFPGGGYTRTGHPIRIHMTPAIRFRIKDVDAAIAEADRRVNERV
jgi:hypothetical protein